MNEEDAIKNQDPDKDLLDKIQARLAVTEHLGYDPHTRDLLQRAHERISRAAKWDKEYDDWLKRGREISMMDMLSWSIMFHIGQWWADRPWRKRPK